MSFADALRKAATIHQPTPTIVVPQAGVRVLPRTKETESEINLALRLDEARMKPVDELIDHANRITEKELLTPPVVGLTDLIEEGFEFDESQTAAIEGLTHSLKGCLTGAAGTGKTTTTKGLIQRLKSGISDISMDDYWKTKDKKGKEIDVKDSIKTDEDDDYVAPTGKIPAIALAAYTGRASQQIKKNFPKDWHGNIMTIHRMLGFYPEFFEEDVWNDFENQYETKETMRFIPMYDENNKLPWDIIVLDEAGMIPVDLWELLRKALKAGCRIIMIGDINQLPPVHGRSIFGFAMGAWPTFELTKIHRQTGVNNAIVENAWQVINGKVLLPENPKTMTLDGGNESLVEALNWIVDTDFKFAAMKIPGLASQASMRVRMVMQLLTANDWYDPIRDTTITPINGLDGSRGYQLGQIPMNRELAIAFNGDATRYIIDAGREHKYFAIGDKVMATKNDWAAGITNGMTGVIQDIQPNEGYAGEKRRFGPMDEVNQWLADEGLGDAEHVQLDMNALKNTLMAQREGKVKAKEGRDRGPSSHIITVKFGEGKHATEQAFGSLAEVNTLQTAYVVTCHKMQGGESPIIIIICHDAHAMMMYREWLYTAITRSSQRCLLLYTDKALNSALRKQKVKGANLAEKIEMFIALSTSNSIETEQGTLDLGPSVNVNLEWAA
jgi:ATP-dependent exoDNAse (exonuclease V) alpha subunit